MLQHIWINRDIANEIIRAIMIHRLTTCKNCIFSFRDASAAVLCVNDPTFESIPKQQIWDQCVRAYALCKIAVPKTPTDLTIGVTTPKNGQGPQ
jgi:hypothetical protein